MEGLLNKALRVLWNPQIEGRSAGWNVFDPFLQMEDSGDIRWNDYNRQIQAYKIATVFTCVNTIAESTASVPLKMYAIKRSESEEFKVTPTARVPDADKKYLLSSASVRGWMQRAAGKDIEEVTGHWLLDLLAAPNNHMTRTKFMQKIVQWLGLNGNCYLKLNGFTLSNKPTWVEFKTPDTMKPIPDNSGGVKVYRERKKADVINHMPADIIHFWRPGPFSEYEGISPMIAAYRLAKMEEKGHIYNHNTFDNMGIPAAALMSDKQIPDKTWDRLEKQFKERHGGYRNANKTMILEGAVKLERLGFGPREMAWIESDKMSRERICNIYKVPLSMVTLEHNNQATDRSQNRKYWQNTIKPICTLIDEELTVNLAHLVDDRYFFAFENPVPEDELLKAQIRKINLTSGYSAPNEERVENNLEPVDGGDEPLIPAGMMPLSMACSTPMMQMSADEIVGKAIDKANEKLHRNMLDIGEACGHEH